MDITISKAWSAYSCNGHRKCLPRCSKEDFKAVNISIANISCAWERSTLVIIPRIWRPSHIWTAEKHVRTRVLRSLRLIWRPGLNNWCDLIQGNWMLAFAFLLSMYMYSLVITLTFTVARASAETTPSLYYQSLIDVTLAIALIGSTWVI